MYHIGDRRVGVEDTPQTPCVRANRLRLREFLSTNVRVNWGKRAVRIDQDAEKVTVWFEDGTTARGDVLVGADGTFSAGKWRTLWAYSELPAESCMLIDTLSPSVREYVLQKANSEVLQAIDEAIILGNVTLSGAAFERQLRLRP